MYTNIKIQATYSDSSGNKKYKKSESFRRFEFNHPLNPFRLTSDESRMHINHLNAKDINEGLISSFEKRLDKIQTTLISKEKNIELISQLTNDLYHEVSAFSTIPCTSNIDTSIFEHLNYILQLLYDWQDYAVILKKIEENTSLYLKKVCQKFEVSPQEVEIKINHFSRKFIKLTEEILSEILTVKEAIREEHIKGVYPSKRSKK